MQSSDVTSSSGNVFADLGLDAPADVAAKAELMSKVAAFVSERELTQNAAAKLLGIDQPQVSALLTGKLSLFSTQRLMEFLTVLGNDGKIVVKERSKGGSGPGRIQVVAALRQRGTDAKKDA